MTSEFIPGRQEKSNPLAPRTGLAELLRGENVEAFDDGRRRKQRRRLFGEGSNAAARQAGLRDRGSLLDSFSVDIAKLKQRVGVPDRVRVDQYLDSVRSVEREIERAERAAADPKTRDLDRPVGVPWP